MTLGDRERTEDPGKEIPVREAGWVLGRVTTWRGYGYGTVYSY